MPTTLPVSRLVNVQVSLTPAGAKAQNLSTLLLLTSGDTIDPIEQYRMYGSYTETLADFGASSAVGLAANSYFSQTPQPRQLMVGGWARAARSGGLRCALLSTVQQQISNWSSITNGAFAVQVDGAAAIQVTGMNFSAATSMDAVAAIVSTALPGGSCSWSPSFSRFNFLSDTTGTTSAISFLTAPSAGTDISGQLRGLSSNSGAYVYAGTTSQNVGTALVNFDRDYGQLWYAASISQVVSTVLGDQVHLDAAAAIQAMTNKHLYFLSTFDAATLLAANTTDLAYVLKSLDRTRTFAQYASGPTANNANAQCSAAAKLLGVDYNASQSALTLMYKTEPGVVAENLNSTQAAALDGKNCNVFVAYDNDTAILQNGVMSSGDFADTVAFMDWLATTLQTVAYNVLYTTLTRVPQTDSGMHLLTTACERVLQQGVVNGYIAPGQWNGDGFGTLKNGDLLPNGYYIYAARVDTQLPQDRAARKAMPIQIAVKLAGAVHTMTISVVVNQ